MFTAIFLALVVVANSVAAFLLLRKRTKGGAPEAMTWIGPIGLGAVGYTMPVRFEVWSYDGLSILLSIVASMEEFLEKPITPMVVVFVEGLLPLPGGKTAAGLYHSDKLWTYAWIELSVGAGDWRPKTLRETAFEHELMHHATGLGDSKKFKELFAAYKTLHP